MRAHMIRRVAVTGVAGAVVLGAAGAANAAEQQQNVELRLAYVTTSQHPYGVAVDYFAREVRRLSNGRITITTRPSYPQAEPNLLADVRAGTFEMATISTAIWDGAGINSFQALQAPFLVNGYALERQIIAGPTGRRMAAAATRQARNVVVLAIAEGGLRKPVATRPLTSISAFRGASIRAPQSRVLETGLRAIGAEPDPIPLPEVYNSLKNGTVTGMEANLGLIATNKFYEVARYVTGNVNFWPFPHALTINRETWNRLSRQDQTVLRRAAARVPAYSIGVVSAPSQLPQQLVNCGVRFVNASPRELRRFESRGRTAYAVLSRRDATTGRFIREIQAIKK
ncbi:MAG TPA: TRAP transporter substrate-binding protein, partial [Miltoncostaeaceae bacterium]|nr:TRAP transporter substrate-binding protein [Miltoncostaeaceae bacterium]